MRKSMHQYDCKARSVTGSCVGRQEESALCSLSGGAATPDSQLDESTSPADTTEDDPLPLRPWGRSQSLPAYADFIMVRRAREDGANASATRQPERLQETPKPKPRSL